MVSPSSILEATAPHDFTKQEVRIGANAWDSKH